MTTQEKWTLWCAQPELPAGLRQELLAMEHDLQMLESCFGAELQFGTAGMRGLMGAGTNRLNAYTVRRAAQGMAAWLSGTALPQRCAIAYDSRHNSQNFAEICAVAMAERGIEVQLFHQLAPTPMLSYAVRQLQCGCGIVISASHNAGTYNGVKCYGSDGCQMTDTPAAIVTAEIEKIPYFTEPAVTFAQAMEKGLIRYIPQSFWDDYYDRVMQEALVDPAVTAKAKLRVVYTPLCGTGNQPVREILHRLGVQVAVVACQEQPNGEFETCEYPNPETDEALRESYRLAETSHPDLILGTDPDCDRAAIALPVHGGFRKLTGNELGLLLLDYILARRTEAGDLPEGAEVVRSIVTTPLTDKIAAHYGCETKAVLTGFKYIGGEILRLEQLGQADRFVFGYEESCGYLKGAYVRDKDAVIASMLICEMAAWYKAAGSGLLERLEQLYAQYGYYLAQVQSVALTGADAMEKAAAILHRFRSDCPRTVAGLPVVKISDYLSSQCTDLETGESAPIRQPKSNVLELVFAGGSSIVVRPSGTEPKVKLYYTAVGGNAEDAAALLRQFQTEMQAFLPK